MVALARVAAIVLAATFAWAAAAKLFNFNEWKSSLAGFGIRSGSGVIAFVVPVLELAAAGLLVLVDRRAGAALSLALVALFSIALVRARSLRGSRLPCGCFGRTKQRDFRILLARNTVLTILAAVVLVAGSRPWTTAAAVPRPRDVLPAALVTAGLALLTWMVLQARAALAKGRQ